MASDASLAPEPRPGGLLSGLGYWVTGWIADIGGTVYDWISGLGSISIFAFTMVGWLFPAGRVRTILLLPDWRAQPAGGCRLTGTFIGMVLPCRATPNFACWACRRGWER